VVDRIGGARDRIADIARRHGLAPLPSAANFVTIDCGADGTFARAVLDELLARDVFARKPAVAPLDRCIRVSCGRDEDLAIFERVLSEALPAAREKVHRNS
jgi:histidinol-phosphate aminotransferase